MLEQLISSLKSEIGGQLGNQAQLSSGKLEGVFSVISNVVKNEVTGQMARGNLSHLMNLFSDKTNTDAANQIQSNIHSGVVDALVSKLGLSPEASSQVAQTAVPKLINIITKKNNTTPDNDPSPLHEIFGGGGKGIIGEAENLLGGIFK
jgi:uncharacterized protein YidB (DUF937 family)